MTDNQFLALHLLLRRQQGNTVALIAKSASAIYFPEIMFRAKDVAAQSELGQSWLLRELTDFAQDSFRYGSIAFCLGLKPQLLVQFRGIPFGGTEAKRLTVTFSKDTQRGSLLNRPRTSGQTVRYQSRAKEHVEPASNL